MKLYPEYLFKDRPYGPDDELPSGGGLRVWSGDCRLYGYTLLPGGAKGEKHPLVIMLHGFPGHTTNHDIAQCLRRMGCVVVNPFFRGAWGSEGYYTFDGLVEDVQAVANWMRKDDVADQYAIDTEEVFFVGHSMGGFAAINALRRLPWIKGAVLMAPYDMPWFFENDRIDDFIPLLNEGTCLCQQSCTSLYNNAQACYKELAFSQAFDDLKDRNLYFIGGLKDTVAPVSTMIEPLFNRIRAYGSQKAVQHYDLLPSDHSFSDMRIALCQKVCQWICDVVQDKDN